MNASGVVPLKYDDGRLGPRRDSVLTFDMADRGDRLRAKTPENRVTRLTAPTYNSGLYTGSHRYFPMAGHYINLTDYVASIGGYPILTPLQAKMIDNKYDNGVPGTGRIISQPQNDSRTPNCASSADPATATYRTDLNTKECDIYFQISNGPF